MLCNIKINWYHVSLEKTLEDKSRSSSNKAIITKENNIGSDEKPKKIIFGFSYDNTTKEDVLDLFESNERSIISSYINMLRIDPNIAKQELHVNPIYKAVKQKARKIAQHLWEVVKVEVDNLKAIEFIREVKYPKWICNIVAVPKHNGKVGVYWFHKIKWCLSKG